MTDRVPCHSATGLLLVLVSLCMMQFATAAERNVPDEFATIQAAIDASADGDSVIVAVGNYVENLQLKSGVDVRGVEAARTFIEPATPADPAILASGIDNVLFANFTIINAQIGLDVIDSTNLQVASIVFDSAAQIALQVDVDSQVDVLNTMFWNNSIAIRRTTLSDVQVTNSGFVGNTATILGPVAPIIDPDKNVENCGFFDNADLQESGVDTGLGTDAVVGDPLFVATDIFDFHLRQNSPFIDEGLGTDAIDNTTADIGAYGGQFADARPFPIDAPVVTDASGATPPPYSISLEWSANLAYLVADTVLPDDRYRVYYRQNQSGPPYDGTDAGNGTQISPVGAGEEITLTLTDLQPAVDNVSVPLLLSVEPRSSSAIVSWEAITGATGYRVYYGTASVDENQLDAGAVTSASVGGLQNGTEYRFAVSALAQSVYHFAITAVTVVDSTPNSHESEFSPESTLAIGPLTESEQSNELLATPDVTTPYPDLPDKGCFVATAAFGVDWTAEVQALRDFRDRFLMTNLPGRVLVRWYYHNGPSAATLISEYDAVRPFIRALLWPLIVMALFVLAASPLASFGMIMLCLILVAGRVRKIFRYYLIRADE